jgi:hypothetical protein
MSSRVFLWLLFSLLGLVILTSPPLLGALLRVDPTPTATPTPITPTLTPTMTPDPFAAVPTATPLSNRAAILRALPTPPALNDSASGVSSPTPSLEAPR